MQDLYSRHTRKARKRHVCDLCGGAILPGREYILSKSHDTDGSFSEGKLHIHCDAIYDAYLRDGGEDDIFDPEDIRDWARARAGCKKCQEEDGECDGDVVTCQLAMVYIVPPQLTMAVWASIEGNRESRND